MLTLLTHANHLFSDRKQREKMQPYPPLQTLICASVLRNAGHRVVFFDTTFDTDIEYAIAHHRPDLVAVCEDNFNYLTKMCLTENRKLAFRIATAAKTHGTPAVMNSSDATDHPELYLDNGFDRVILGEVEATLTELCERWPHSVSGTASRSETGALQFTGPRTPIASLDTLPSPAWDLLDPQPYRHAWRTVHGSYSVNFVTSRGCPFRCNWCAKPLYGSSYRHLSPTRAAMEIAAIKKELAPDQIWFADDIFGLSHRWTREFALEIERLDARVPFKMQSRCDLMTRETVDYLRRAGCNEVWMGAESGSQRILDAMEKGIQVGDIYEARRNLRRHGIRACFFLQFGYLGEEWDDIEQTIRMVRETQPDDVGISVSYPLPRTPFYDIVNAQLGRKSNWNDSADLSMMFHGAYSSDFYRALSTALHLEVRQQGSADGIQHAWQEVEQLRCVSC